MAIKITEDGNVIYENEPTVERELLPNITDGEQYAKQAEEALERIEEIAESIPEDYSQLSEDVTELKNDFIQVQEKVGGDINIATRTADTIIGTDGSVKYPSDTITFREADIPEGVTSVTFTFNALGETSTHWFNQIDANGNVLSYEPFYTINSPVIVENLLSDTKKIKYSVWTDNNGSAVTYHKEPIFVLAGSSDLYASFVTEAATGAIASFSDGADDVPVKDLTVAIEPVQSGSGDPSPENVRPISGWTGANVTACGVNIFNPDASTYETFDLTGQGTYRYGHAYPSGTYTIIYTGTNDYFFYRVPTKDLSDRGTTVNIAPNSTTTVTVDANHMLWVFTQSTDNPASDLMVAVGTETVFKAFQGETYEVDWTTEAGTVYGGTLDVTTRVLTVTDGIFTFDGTESWYSITSGTDSNRALSLLLASTAPKGSYSWDLIGTYIMPTNFAHSIPPVWCANFNPTGELLIGIPTTITTVEEWKTYLASNPLTVVYELATPQTYQLTPHEVSTVLGQNNIFADTGNVTVQYRADTKLYIDKVLSA